MLPCNSPSKGSMEKWSRRLLKMSIGYVGYVGYNNKLPYIWVSNPYLGEGDLLT